MTLVYSSLKYLIQRKTDAHQHLYCPTSNTLRFTYNQSWNILCPILSLMVSPPLRDVIPAILPSLIYISIFVVVVVSTNTLHINMVILYLPWKISCPMTSLDTCSYLCFSSKKQKQTKTSKKPSPWKMVYICYLNLPLWNFLLNPVQLDFVSYT